MEGWCRASAWARTGRPLVGLSTSEMRRPAAVRPLAQGEPARTELALGMAYVEAVHRAGGAPVILPPLPREAAEEVLAPVDALLVPGGPDIHPAAYGAVPHPELGPTEPELDAFELALVRAADRRGLPVLGICRGAQVLNVARGGNLFQHLPDEVGETVTHRQPDAIARPTHTVRISAGSALRRATGRAGAWVNSLHHQGIARLGDGLSAVAWAPDGAVEAVEADDGFTLGVQWHAEALVGRPEHLAVLRALVDAARPRGRAGRAA